MFPDRDKSMVIPHAFTGRTRSVLILALVICVLAAGCTAPGPGTSSLRKDTTGDLRAYFLDVGQGDSSIILFRDKVILIDAGEADYGDTVVRDLARLNVTRIDLLVATHPHSDHIGGMQKVLSAFPVGRVLDSGQPTSSVLYEKFLASIEKKNIPYVVAEEGRTIEVDSSLRILILSPPRERIGDDLNTNSIVLRISYGAVNLLYTGDATTEAEEAMAQSGSLLDAQVLKVGHHGSSGSSSAAFLSRVRPEVAVISLGDANPYGHPHRETMERLQAAMPHIYRTDEDGTVLVESDGATFSVMTENAGDQIWSWSPPFAPVTSGTHAQPGTTSPDPTSPAILAVPVTLPTLPPDITVPVPAVTIPPVQLGNASALQITAVQFDAPGDDRSNLNGEWVRLVNNGDEPVLLAGWTLSDKDTPGLYTFPAFILLPDQTVTICVGSGRMNDTTLFMGRTEPVFSNSGDEAVLIDGSGTVIDRRIE